jgi:hypothetical protein
MQLTDVKIALHVHNMGRQEGWCVLLSLHLLVCVLETYSHQIIYIPQPALCACDMYVCTRGILSDKAAAATAWSLGVCQHSSQLHGAL